MPVSYFSSTVILDAIEACVLFNQEGTPEGVSSGI